MKITDLNLKQGIMRLWIAIALFWVVITGLIFHTAIKTFINPTFMPVAYLFDGDKKLFSKFENYFDQFDSNFGSEYNKIEIENNVTIIFRKNFTEEQIKSLSEFKNFITETIKTRKQEIDDLRSSFLHSVLPFIVLPPIIILIIGFVLRWVILGFID